MKRLLLIAALFSTMLACGQKIESDKVDAFTKSRTVASKEERICPNPFLWAVAYSATGMEPSKSDTLLFLYFRFDHGHLLSVSQKNSILFKLQDGTILSKKYPGAYQLYSSSQYAESHVIIDKSDIDTFRSNPPTSIRIETDDRNYDFELKEKSRGMLAEMLSIVSQKIKL